MESEKWKVDSGKWRVKSGKWRSSGEVKSGEVKSGKWKVKSGEAAVKYNSSLYTTCVEFPFSTPC